MSADNDEVLENVWEYIARLGNAQSDSELKRQMRQTDTEELKRICIAAYNKSYEKVNKVIRDVLEERGVSV